MRSKTDSFILSENYVLVTTYFIVMLSFIIHVTSRHVTILFPRHIKIVFCQRHGKVQK